MDGERLIEDADAAMYRAKERGGARTELFDTAMRDRAVEALEIEQELQRALEHGELRLFYQPAWTSPRAPSWAPKRCVRWEHPERGLLTPDKFLHVAEETGLIVPLGAWVVGRPAVAWPRGARGPRARRCGCRSTWARAS